jgi:SpoVK/Ycf46/Vps4 family AAA+-type ATPase
MKRQVKPYKNNLEYLTASVTYLDTLARSRVLERKLQDRAIPPDKMTGYEEWFERDDDSEDLLGIKRRGWQRALKQMRGRLTRIKRVLTVRTQATVQEGRIELPLETLATEHALSEFEKFVLHMALGPNLDSTFRRTLEAVNRSRSLDMQTVLDVLCDDLEHKVRARRYFVHTGRLLAHGLISLAYSHRDQNSESDFMGMDIGLPRRISSLILGEYDVEDSLLTFSSVIDPEVDLDQVVLPPGQKEEVLRLVQNRDDYQRYRQEWGFDQTISYGRGIVLLFAGSSGTGKTMLAQALATRSKSRLMLVDVRKIADHSKRGFEENLQRVFHEARLQRAIVFFDEADEVFSDRSLNSAMPTILREFERLDGVAILATNRAVVIDEAMQRRILYRLDFEIPTPDLRAEIWRKHLPESAPLADDIDCKALADEFEFAGGFVKNAVLLAMNRAMQRPEGERVITMADLRAGAVAQRRNRLQAHTDKVIPKVTLADVVLPEQTRRQVEAFVAAARKRSTVYSAWGFGDKMSLGKTLSALFVGDSGVGKTLTAEAVAAELGLALHVVRLSSLTSAYVGQTEKNLTRLFESAKETGETLIFIDEADSLFRARLDEGNHHAHYINQQVNCLLTEIEKFDGIVVLASNRPESFDPAFQRRIRYRITFPKPDESAREALWRTLVPEQCPMDDDVDFARMAREHEFTGGTIRNVLLRGAFEAATNGMVLTEALIRQCAEDESPLKEERQIGFGVK